MIIRNRRSFMIDMQNLRYRTNETVTFRLFW